MKKKNINGKNTKAEKIPHNYSPEKKEICGKKIMFITTRIILSATFPLLFFRNSEIWIYGYINEKR